MLEQKARAAELAQQQEALQRKTADAQLILERQRASQVRRFNVALIAVALATSALLAWALWERQRAVKAQEESQQSLNSLVSLNAQNQALEDSRAAGVAKVQEAASVLESTQPDKGYQASVLLAQANNAYTAPDPAASAAAATCPNGRRIYPQVGEATDRAVVDRVTPALLQAGFIVPRTEVVGPDKMPASTEVRYFRRAEAAGAADATGALAKAGLADVPARYVAKYENSTTIRPCHYELWIGTGKR